MRAFLVVKFVRHEGFSDILGVVATRAEADLLFSMAAADREFDELPSSYEPPMTAPGRILVQTRGVEQFMLIETWS